MPSETRVLVDANVLFSRTLRDWVLMLSLEAQMFQVFTSESILAETLHRYRHKRPTADEEQIALIRQRVVDSIGPARVLTSFPIPGSLPSPCPDPHDAHVHAAAIAAEAGILLTDDGGFHDIEPDTADTLPYEVYNADDFLTLVDDCHPRVVRTVLAKQLAYFLLRTSDFSLPQRLIDAGCPAFASRVRTHLRTMELPR